MRQITCYNFCSVLTFESLASSGIVGTTRCFKVTLWRLAGCWLSVVSLFHTLDPKRGGRGMSSCRRGGGGFVSVLWERGRLKGSKMTIIRMNCVRVSVNAALHFQNCCSCAFLDAQTVTLMESRDWQTVFCCLSSSADGPALRSASTSTVVSVRLL